MRFFYFFVFLLSLEAHAYQSSLNSSGKGVTWSNSQIPLVIYPSNSDMPSATASAIIQQSVNEWNAQTSTKIIPSSTGLSEVRFKSDFSIYGPGVIGVTELTFTSGGAIQQAKVLLNDENYTFRSTPVHSTGEVYLGDVVSHELGHMLGLSHSEVLDATMFYASFPGQNTLAADDKAGVKSKYGSSFGTISGVVQGGSNVGIGVLGVHVVAFSRKTGEAVSTITDQSGSFSIKGLNLNDSYYLYTSPLKNLSALPGKFANTKNDFCPASYVGGFFDACGKENEGFPQGIYLSSSSPKVNVGTVTIHCSLKASEDYSYEKLQLSPGPVTIFDYASEQKPAKAFVGYFLTKNSLAWSAYDRLVLDLSGYSDTFSQRFLRVHLLARQFGNLLEYEMKIERNGVEVGTYQIPDPASVLTLSTDLSALVPLDSNPVNNVFEIFIRARKLSLVTSLQVFAELDQFVTNKNLPYLLLAGIESASGAIPDTEANLSDNKACLDAPFTYPVSNARALASNSELTRNDDETTPVSCGTTGSSPSGPGGPGTMLFALGFMMVMFLASLRRSAKNFLS